MMPKLETMNRESSEPPPLARTSAFPGLLGRLKARVAPTRPPPGPPPTPPMPPTTEFQRLLGRDQLTGLPNRACFAHHVALQNTLAGQFETRLSVLVIDWEGHDTPPSTPQDVRNARLAEIAGRLGATLHRPYDMLGSLGRGRFAALLPFTDAPGSEHVARNLHAQLQFAPVRAPQPKVERLRIGMATYCGKGVLPPGALLRAAERAADFAALSGATLTARFDPTALAA